MWKSLIACTHCVLVLFHGYMSSPDQCFKPWLKQELEQVGYRVVVPALPSPNDPTYVMLMFTFTFPSEGGKF